MIKNIQSLKGFGVFRNYMNAHAKDFGTYNLFFGWNGSGKSTLSHVFWCMERKKPSEKFLSSEFLANTTDGTRITQENITESNLNIHTFNNDFVSEHISWNEVVKSILLFDRKNIQERRKLEVRLAEQASDIEKHKKEDDAIQKLRDRVSKFESNTAKFIKESLRTIDTSDKYYSNYNKTKLEDFISENLSTADMDTPPLTEAQINELVEVAKPTPKDSITPNLPTIKQKTFTVAKTRLNTLLKTSVVNKTIQRLAEHGDINSWVETGLALHKAHNTNQCEFCGNPIAKERVQQIKEHFNDDYKDFQSKLKRAQKWLEDQRIQDPTLPEKSNLYEELQQEYSLACTALNNAITDLNEEISAWLTTLNQKIGNPLETNLTVGAINDSSIRAFNATIDSVHTIIHKHNNKSNNFKEATDKAKKKLELHHAATEIRDFGYHEKKKAIVDRTNANNTLQATINSRKTEILTLENSSSNEGLGADKFNKSLHKFLGRNELTLRFNPDKQGYEILRNGTDLVKGHLSESEKTAIAFVYFITKLKEKDNKIKDTIIVIDDPVSSFDSNYLFHAYSFMKIHCQGARQLFVLTHNFTFFKLVRDWLLRKREHDDKSTANFYSIEANNGKPRTSTCKDARPALIQYNSEYHYIFSRLHALRETPPLEITEDDLFCAANLARKLLEAFLSFKFPRKRGTFANLFQTAVSTSANPNDESKEKIRRFVNAYSHDDFIETDESFIETLMGEGTTVIADIFEWIKELDERHYKEMMQVLKA